MSDPPQSSLRVAISGGGIGGCALALALQRCGVSIVLLEKDTSFSQRRQGYGLTLQQGHRGCHVLGLADQLVARDTPSSSHIIFAADGRLVSFFGPAFFARASLPVERKQREQKRPEKSLTNKKSSQQRHLSQPNDAQAQLLFHTQTPAVTTAVTQISSSDSSTPPCASISKPKCKWNPPDTRKGKLHNVHTPRQVLRHLLMEQVKPENIRWGSKVIGYTEDDQGVGVKLDNGTIERADLLVGADGIFSSVRQQLVGDSLRYLGVLVILGIASAPYPLLQKRVIQTVNGCTRIFIMPYTEQGPFSSHSSVMWQLSFPCEEADARRLSSDAALLRAEALSRCGTWHSPLPELLASTPLDQISGTPVFDRDPPLEQHCSSRVVLLGDAAHPMSPFKGQGANQALLDACLLSDLLSKLSIKSAIQEYQKQMCVRASQQVLGSRSCVERLHSEATLSSEDWAQQRGLDPAHIDAVKHIGAWCSDIEATIIAALGKSEENR